MSGPATRLAGDALVSGPMPHQAAAPGEIVLLAPPDRMRAWLPRLAEALGQRLSVPVRLLRSPVPLPAEPPLPSEPVERRLFGTTAQDLAAWMPTAALPQAAAVAPTALVVNATGQDPTSLPDSLRSAWILSLLHHGRFETGGLAAPLLAGEAPHLGVLLGTPEASRLLLGARLAVPQRDALGHALDSILGRAVTLLCLAAEHLLTGRPLPEPAPLPEPEAGLRAASYWPRRLASATLPKFGRQFTKPLLRYEDWCFGYRRQQGAGSPLDLSLDAASFRILDSSPDRFYADPVIFAHEGVTAIFFEDYDYTTHRGRISHVVLDAEGRASAPVETLTLPYHLSYPFVFRVGEDVLMIPESSENRTIQLWEAERFPDRWRLRSVLMEDIEAADTTLHFDHGTGLWWMFAAVTEYGSCSHDTLSLFSSERLEGPWLPHPGNPVKLDPGTARPAGPLVEWEGRLFRPAQDCTASYGAGLVWCEIQELSRERYRETVVARHAAPRGYTGIHTYGRGGGFEVADFKRNRWRRGG
ncbi:MAG: hypothetical protein AAGC69_00375 [Paracraurococcus sp.]|jgi:hypothetical protein